MKQDIGTPGKQGALRMLLLGSGELGKEVVIEAQRLGVEVVAVDRYEHAPAMQVAHRFHVTQMLDGRALRAIIDAERPDFIVPEIEAIHTPTLLELEREGHTVIPTARAARLTMDREGIRRLAAEELGLPTSPYHFVENEGQYRAAIAELGFPFVIKPIMSSSGKGQSLVRNAAEVGQAWAYAQSGGRAGAGRCIVEGFVDFDYEITLLTLRHVHGTSFCEPIGHRQEDGDYRESWQPQPMTDTARARAEEIARTITDDLGGRGIFGVELFVKGDEVLFSEVSPRPHDTGMVTMVSQDLSEFALHVRAILGLPIPEITQRGPSASAVILVEGDGEGPCFRGVDTALAVSGVDVRLFGKPEVIGKRRMGVCIARADQVADARKNATTAAEAVRAVTANGEPWPG